MKLDLSFWRVVLIIRLAKSGTWARSGDLYLFHIGTFTDGKNTAVKIILIPLLIQIGFIK